MNQSEKQYNKKLSRGELENRFKWRLEDLFESDELWEEEFGRIDGLVEQLSAFRGRVVESDESLLSVLELSDELGLVFDFRFRTQAFKERFESVTHCCALVNIVLLYGYIVYS